MTQELLRQMYGATPDSFQHRVAYALQQTQKRPARRKHSLRTGLLVAMLILLLSAVAYAAFSSQVIAFFSRMYGSDMQSWLEKGDVATANRSFVLDGVVFTVNEVVYRDNGLYGVGTIRPVDGSAAVLIPEDHTPDEPYGYDVYGEGGMPEKAPAGTPTITDKVREKGGKLLVVRAIPDLIGVDGGTLLAPDSVGYTNMPQRDGSIRFSFELSDAYAVEEGELYTIQMMASVCEMTVDGDTLMDTRHGEDWTVDIKPSPISNQQ